MAKDRTYYVDPPRETKTSEELQADVDAFLKGKEIEQVPQGKTGITKRVYLRSGMGSGKD